MRWTSTTTSKVKWRSDAAAWLDAAVSRGRSRTVVQAADSPARAERNDPQGFQNNANVKLFRALSQLIMEVVPSDPSRDEFRLGNTLGPTYRHWRRAKIGRRFRLFFRYDSRPGRSCMHGSTTKRPCGRRAANPTLTQCPGFSPGCPAPALPRWRTALR